MYGNIGHMIIVIPRDSLDKSNVIFDKKISSYLIIYTHKN